MPNLEGGGAERVLINIMRQLDKNIFDIYLVLVDKSGDYLELVPNEVNIIDLNTKNISKSFFKLRSVLKEIEPNILFSSLFTTNIMLYLSSLFLLKNSKIVLRSPNSPKLVLENNQMSLLMKFLLERAYNKADYILAQTPEMKYEINKYHNINDDKIITFLNPLDTEFIDNKTLNISNPFDTHYINVVASGRLHKQKGFDTLIKSFKYVIEKNDKFRLYIIGKDKGEEDYLRTLIKNLKLGNFVKLLGFQDNPYRFYFYSDLFVLSSRWEGLPNAVLENLYLNKPIVATKCIPFMNTLIDDGKNGFLVEIDNETELANKILKYKSLSPDKGYKGEDINKLFQKINKGNLK